MEIRNGQYIKLKGKKPCHSFKDGIGTKTWREVEEDDDVAVVVPDGYVVLDFDTAQDAKSMLQIVDALDLKTNVMQTTRGIHCWFKTKEDNPKNFIKSRLAVGIYCDRKTGGRNSFVKIKEKGFPRPWIRDQYEMEELETVPFFLSCVSAPTDKYDFMNMTDGSGRNNELFTYIPYLQDRGYTKEQIKEVIKVINSYVFTESLSDYEIGTITRDEAFKPENEIKYFRGDKFKHNEFGKHLINKYHIVSIDGHLYSYVSDHYKFNYNLVEELSIIELDDITIKERKETSEYIRLKAPKKQFADKRYIVVKNGILDVETGDLSSHSKDYIIPNYINFKYNKDAYHADLDCMLNNVSCNNKEVRSMLEETLGYCLYRENTEQVAIILTGEGKNGKSTILNLFQSVLGEDNYSSEPLEKLGDRFSLANLFGKLANIADDIDSSGKVNSAEFKRVCVKGTQSAEFKNKDKFKFVSYATPIFTANSIPRIGQGEDAEAVNRRIKIVPFEAEFSPESPNYDKNIEEKISTPEAREYMLKLAVDGLLRVLEHGFTKCALADEEKQEYIYENDPYSAFFAFIDDKYEDVVNEYIIKEYTRNIYIDFEGFCITNGYTEYTRTAFGKRVKSYYGLDKKFIQDRSTGNRRYKLKAKRIAA